MPSRESRLRGFDVIGRRGQTYSFEGALKLTEEARIKVTKNLRSERLRLSVAKRNLASSQKNWKETRGKKERAAISSKFKLHQEEAIRAEISYLKKYFHLLMRFPGVIPFRLSLLVRLNVLTTELGSERMHAQTRNFRGFIRSKNFSSQRRKLSKLVKWDYDFKDHLEKIPRETRFITRTKNEAEKSIAHLLKLYEQENASKEGHKGLERVPKKLVSEYSKIIIKVLDSQIGYVYANISFLKFLIESSKEAKLSEAFINQLRNFEARTKDTGDLISQEREFWFKLTR